MKVTAVVILALCLLSVANCFPTEDEKQSNPFDCTPVDGWNVIATFYCGFFGDDTDTYSLTLGTTFATNTASQEADAFFQLFADELGKFCCLQFDMNNLKIISLTGTSNVTNYDWSILSSIVKGPETTTTRSITYPCHKSVKVLQAIGKCGASTIRTEFTKVE